MSDVPDNDGIAVVVVTHRSAATVDACLERLRMAEAVQGVGIVDNASDDATLAIIQRHAVADPRVRFVANPDNPGFSVACNQGAAELASRGCMPRWLAFVNPDCLVGPDSLARLRDAALRLGGDALVGADLVDAAGARDGAARRRDPDFAGMVAGLLRGRAPRLDVPRAPGEALQVVDAVSGALMLLPRARFEAVGGFDAGYRLHAEDLDLCRRVRAGGAVVAVANDVSVVHVRGVSGRTRPLFVEWHKHRGLWRYFRRFEAPAHPWPVRAAVFAATWARFPFAAWRAWRDARARRAGAG